MKQNSLIVRAAEKVGSKAELARRLGVKSPTVHQWIKGERPVPAKWCKQIEDVTGGEIKKEELRPDIFGDVTKSVAAA